MSDSHSTADGTFLVTSVAGDNVTLHPVGDPLGGPALPPIARQSIECENCAEGTGTPIAPGDLLRGLIEWGDDRAEGIVEWVGHAVKAKAKAKADHWTVKSGKHEATINHPRGLDQRETQMAQQADCWIVVSDTGAVTAMFQDLQGFLDAKRIEKDRERAERETKQWRDDRKNYAPDRFVNPYNFVRLPQVPPDRREPNGHALRRPELLHGRIRLTYQAKSPLLLRDESTSSDGVGRFPRRLGHLAIPGSSMKGAIRSLYEAVTGSCLRVVDLDFIPAYRDILRAGNRGGWHIVEVVETDDAGRPTRVRKSTGDPVWVVFDALTSVLGQDGVRTGARFRMTGQAKKVGSGAASRREVRAHEDLAPAESEDGVEMILLVTDTRARPKNKATCFVAAALSDRPTEVTVDPQGWRRFEAAARGGDDLKRGRPLRTTADDMVEVTIDNKSRGTAYRQPAGRPARDGKVQTGLKPGHVVWARFESGKIRDLSFAQTWRHGASGEDIDTASRLPESFHSCTGGDGLCPACRVFGSADTRGGASGSDGRAYRGHVRLGDFRVAGQTREENLAPMGEPRPGSGQMYLMPAESDRPLTRAPDGHVPLREWGSQIDTGEPRQLRGRKFYWRTSEPGGKRPPRYRAHTSHFGKDNAGTLAKRAEVVQPDAEVTGELTFENLTEAELGALLVALDPSLLRDHQTEFRRGEAGTFCISVGGGKPLGLGSLECREMSVELEGARDRYLGGGSQPGDPRALADAFVHDAPEELRRTWQDLLELTRWDAVHPAMVSYPPQSPWPADAHADAPDLYEAGFAWWTRSAGMPRDAVGGRELQETYSYVTLPTATDQRLTMPIEISDESTE